MLGVLGMAAYTSLVKFWPYNLELSLDHYRYGLAEAGKRIPEDILKAKCVKALELKEYDPEKFTANINTIKVPSM